MRWESYTRNPTERTRLSCSRFILCDFPNHRGRKGLTGTAGKKGRGQVGSCHTCRHNSRTFLCCNEIALSISAIRTLHRGTLHLGTMADGNNITESGSEERPPDAGLDYLVRSAANLAKRVKFQSTSREEEERQLELQAAELVELRANGPEHMQERLHQLGKTESELRDQLRRWSGANDNLQISCQQLRAEVERLRGIEAEKQRLQDEVERLQRLQASHSRSAGSEPGIQRTQPARGPSNNTSQTLAASKPACTFPSHPRHRRRG